MITLIDGKFHVKILKFWYRFIHCRLRMKPSIEDTKLSDRNFSLEEFFDGETVAYGQFQDILGNVSRRF